jgi:hypothetical protein
MLSLLSVKFNNLGATSKTCSSTLKKCVENSLKSLMNSFRLILMLSSSLSKPSICNSLLLSLLKMDTYRRLRVLTTSLLSVRRLYKDSWKTRKLVSLDSTLSHPLIYLISYPMVTYPLRLCLTCLRFSKLLKLLSLNLARTALLLLV